MIRQQVLAPLSGLWGDTVRVHAAGRNSSAGGYSGSGARGRAARELTANLSVSREIPQEEVDRLSLRLTVFWYLDKSLDSGMVIRVWS